MTYVLWEHSETQQHNYTLRIHPGDLDHGRLAEINELVDEVVSASKTLNQALASY
ncbi:hypothetical protein V5J36_004280 [Endozoicomonas sp. NE41]